MILVVGGLFLDDSDPGTKPMTDGRRLWRRSLMMRVKDVKDMQRRACRFPGAAIVRHQN